MSSRDARTAKHTRATTPAEIRRDRSGLLDHLDAVDAEGWGG